MFYAASVVVCMVARTLHWCHKSEVKYQPRPAQKKSSGWFFLPWISIYAFSIIHIFRFFSNTSSYPACLILGPDGFRRTILGLLKNSTPEAFLLVLFAPHFALFSSVLPPISCFPPKKMAGLL